jgi:hypothetical protein
MRRRFVPALVGAAALAATACGAGVSSADPEQELVAAVTSLSADDHAWTLTLDASDSLIKSASEGAEIIGQASLFLDSLQISGRQVAGNGAFEVGVMGVDVLELRSFQEGTKLFARLGVKELLSGFGMDPDAMLGDLGAQGLDPKMEALAGAALNGEWIGLSLDEDALAEAFGDQAEQSVDAQKLIEGLRARFQNPSDLLERIGTVAASDAEGGGVNYDVEINLADAVDFLITEIGPLMSETAGDSAADLADMQAEMAEALVDAPATIPGLRVTVVDGNVTRIILDIDEIARAFDPDLSAEGEASLVMQYTRGGLAPIEEPATSTFLTTEDLIALFAQANLYA